MFCPICGTAYPTEHRFCNQCGSPLPTNASPQDVTSTGTAVAPAHEQSILPIAQESEPQAPVPSHVPYASFLIASIIAILLLSAIAFSVAQCWALNSWNAIKIAALLAALSIITFKLGAQKWQLIRPAVNNNRLKLVLAFISLSFVLASALFGLELGSTRAKLIALEQDWSHLSVIGDRISDHRSHIERTIPAHLEMYRNLSSDVLDFRATVARLLQDEQEYEAQYPEFHDQAESGIKNLRVAERRGLLLQKQVEIAQKISNQEESLRAMTWTLEMRPVLQEEIELGKKN
jgi:hypothetical protein